MGKGRIFSAMVFLLALVSSSAFAQYSQIPDEPDGAACPNTVSACSGYKVRADINARFGGQAPISPFIEGLAYNPIVLTFATQRNYQAGDTFIDFDATSGNISYTLPAWTLGLQLEFKRVDSTIHTVTILANGSNTIDGAASVSLLAKQPITIGAGLGIAGNWDVLQAQGSSAGTNGLLNVKAYGATGNGSTDDAAAIQSAINAACAAEIVVSPIPVSPAVYFPNGNYKTTKPIIVTCGTNSNAALDGLTLFGDNFQTVNLAPTALGPVILVVASNQISQLNSGVITAAPLVTGAGSSLLWAGAGISGQWWVDLTEDLTSLNTSTVTPSPYLNGASAITVRGFFKPTTTGATSFIVDSAATVDYGAFPNHVVIAGGGGDIVGGAFGVWEDTDNKLHGYVATSGGGTQSVTSSATVTLNAVNEFDLEFDGAHTSIALNGTWGTPVVATGTVVQRSDEMTSFGAWMAGFPHSSPQLFWHGSLYDPEIANIARRTLGTNYTQDSAAYTFDSHTIYGSTFSQQMNMPGTSQPVLFGADYFNGAATTSTWASVHTIGLGCCGGHYNISNLTISGGGVAIDVANADVSVQHVQLNNQTVMGINTSPSGTFNSNIHDVRGVAGRMGLLVLEGGITAVDTIYSYACGLLCDLIAGGSFNNAYVAGQSDTLWGVVLTGTVNVNNLTDDAESGGVCSGVTIEVGNGQSPAQPSVISNSNITSCGGANVAPVDLENVSGGAGLLFLGDFFGWAGTPAAVVHQVGSINQSGAIPIFEGDEFGIGVPAPTIPYTDGGVPYQVVGASATVATTLTGTSAGTVVWSEPQQSSSAKSVLVNLIGYENTTGTAQTISYPLAFALAAPAVITDSGSCSGVTTTATTLTLPSSMGSTQNGICEVRGY